MYNDIEALYKAGSLPARYYCQLNGKSATDNYKISREEARQFLALNEKELYAQAEKVIEKALTEIFRGFPGTK